MNYTINKNVFIGHKYNDNPDNSEFTKTINVSFFPDELIVRSIIATDDFFSDGNGANEQELDFGDPFVIKTNLIDDQELCSFNKYAYGIQHLNVRHKINKPINGTYTFTLYDHDNVRGTISNSRVVIHLEFIKY